MLAPELTTTDCRRAGQRRAGLGAWQGIFDEVR